MMTDTGELLNDSSSWADPITNLTAKDCKSYSAECRHTYIDSFLSWSFLVDLDKAQREVSVFDRWGEYAVEYATRSFV